MALTQIKTDAISDDAVTLAKQAAGTDGQIITYDASGNPTAVGPGTDGQVLTSTGAGSPPAFEDVPAGGATINSATENELVTVASNTSQLDAEANLVFDGSKLGIGTSAMGSYSGSADDIVIDNGASDVGITLDSEGQCSIAFTDSTKTGWDGWMKYVHSDDHLEFGSGASERLRITSGGNVGIGTTGPLKLLTVKAGSNTHGLYIAADNQINNGWGFQTDSSTGHLMIDRSVDNNFGYRRLTVHGDGGICFQGDTAAANALDDYEEGSYNPTWAGITNYGSGYNKFFYTKIGRIVHVVGQLRVNTTQNDGTDVSFTLPFTPAAQENAGNTRNVSIGPTMHQNVETGSGGLVTYVYGGNAYGYFYNNVEDGNWWILESQHLSQDDFLYVNFTYMAT